MKLYADEMDSPIGKLVITGSSRGLARVDFGSWREVCDQIQTWAERWHGRGGLANKESVLQFMPGSQAEAVRQLQEYFAGERTRFELTLDLKGTSFQRKVWSALQTIPYGETCSYKDIAAIIGNEKAMRAAGGANNRNPISIIVPCHRVIGQNGQLIGYGGGLHIKRMLLQLENDFSKRML